MVENRYKILVVDDTAMFLELESLFLARSGAVITASSGAAALAMARAQRPDVIVTDLHMLDMDGDALCAAIRADVDLCTIPVIIVTAGENPTDRARAIQAGANDVVAKPISRIALIESVNRYLRAPHLRGLTRVALDTNVRICSGETEDWGRSMNLSRGGIYVAANRIIPVEAEVQLEFQLPETEAPLVSSARVVWWREHARGRRSGMGLQFLALDRASTRKIEAFVYERSTLAHGPQPRSASGLA